MNKYFDGCAEIDVSHDSHSHSHNHFLQWFCLQNKSEKACLLQSSIWSCTELLLKTLNDIKRVCSLQTRDSPKCALPGILGNSKSRMMDADQTPKHKQCRTCCDLRNIRCRIHLLKREREKKTSQGGIEPSILGLRVLHLTNRTTCLSNVDILLRLKLICRAL